MEKKEKRIPEKGHYVGTKNGPMYVYDGVFIYPITEEMLEADIARFDADGSHIISKIVEEWYAANINLEARMAFFSKTELPNTFKK